MFINDINKTQAGKVFYISKHGSSHTVSLVTTGSQTFYGDSSVTNDLETLMVINTESSWHSVKIK